MQYLTKVYVEKGISPNNAHWSGLEASWRRVTLMIFFLVKMGKIFSAGHQHNIIIGGVCHLIMPPWGASKPTEWVWGLGGQIWTKTDQVYGRSRS